MDGIQKNFCSIPSASRQDVSAKALLIARSLDVYQDRVWVSGAAIAPIIVCQNADSEDEHNANEEHGCCPGHCNTSIN